MKRRITSKTAAKVMASARDYECSICMMLMIEPVLLPCRHELCYKCFLLSYTNTNDQCPFCRVRIATWARKAMKNNRVVNTAKWDLIKKLFPERVKCILEGRDIISDEEETEMQIISEDGSLGKEYMAEMEKIESQRLLASQEEEAASLALIEKLCQAESQLLTLSQSGQMSSSSGSSQSDQMGSSSGSSVVAAAGVTPNDRTYSITDEDRLKQIKEEEAASLLLIQQLQMEDVQVIKERLKREESDRQYARMIASALNRPLPTEPVVVEPSDCMTCPPCPSTSLATASVLDTPSIILSGSSASSSSGSSDSSGSGSSDSSGSGSLASSATPGLAAFSGSATSSGSSTSSKSLSSAVILPMSPSTSSADIAYSVTQMSTEDTDKAVMPNSIYRKWETNMKGKKSATTTALTKWLKMSHLPEAALGSISESGSTLLDFVDPVGTDQPIQVNTSSTLLSTVSRPNVAGSTSQQDNFSAAVTLPDLTPPYLTLPDLTPPYLTLPDLTIPDLTICEQRQTFVHPELSSAVSEEMSRDVLTSEFDKVFRLFCDVEESTELCSEVTNESDLIYSNSALSSAGQLNEIPTPNDSMQCSFTQASDSSPTSSSSQINVPKQQSVKHDVTGDAICSATGMLVKSPSSGAPSQISVYAAQRHKKSRRRINLAIGRPKKSRKRSIVYLDEDQEPCCSTSGMLQTAYPSVSSDCCNADKKMWLNWSEDSMLNPEDSGTLAGTPSLSRDDFHSDESYRLYLEEEDHQLALRLQQTFDLESRPRKIHKSAESAR